LTLQAEKAKEFRELHHRKRLLVLPNAWDVPSARLFEDEGFVAVATSSAGMMVSLGYQDGEGIGRGEYLRAVERISRVLSVPLSVDAVAGFGKSPHEVAVTARSLVRAGAIGLNIEDFDPETRKLFPIGYQVEKLKAIQKTGNALGVPLVINARTDALRYAPGDDEARFEEAIRRGSAFRDAGADCIYPMGLVDTDLISSFVKALGFQTNVMVRKGLPSIKELEKLGVARLSFGPSASYATMGLLRRVAKEVLDTEPTPVLPKGR